MKRIVLVFLFATAADAGDSLRERIDRLAAPYIESGVIVGMSIGVLARDGTVVFAGYGKTKSGGAVPNERTFYEIGSITKVFTGVLLASVAQDGLVRIDQPLKELVPAGVKVPMLGRDITLADLATHSSGLARMPDNFQPRNPYDPYADYGDDRMYDFLSRVSLARKPGDRYEYSNFAMGLLGQVIARKAGKPYGELVAARITGPLGMKDTMLALDDERKARLAPGHDADGRPAASWTFDALAPAGALRSTTTDMMTFLRANLAGGDTPVARAMATAREVRFTAGGTRLGLGWHVGVSGIHWHTGQTGGYKSYAAVDTNNKVAVVVLSNTGTGQVDLFGESVLRMLLGVDEKPAKMRQAVTVDEKILKQYPGTYRLAPAFKLVVTLEDGSLMIQATGQQKFQVYPESDTKFFWRVVDAQATFESDKKGNVVALILHQGGVDQRAVRE